MLRLPEVMLFDLDGTLLDSLPGITYSVAVAMRAAGLPDRELNLRPLIGPPIRKIMAHALAIEDEKLLDQLERAFRVSYDDEGWKMTPCFRGATEMLRELHTTGSKLFVVSNKPKHIAVRILETEGVLEMFEEIVTRDSREPAYSGKLEMMQALFIKHGIAAEDCMMVGDTMEDAEASLAAGVPFCLMTHGYGDVPAESEVPVALRLSDFAALVQYSSTKTEGAAHDR